MANVSISVVTAAAIVNAAADLLNGGKIVIYEGNTPASVDAALGTVKVISEHALSADAFATTASATANANAIASATAQASSSTSANKFYRAFDADGVAHRQGGVGAAGSGKALIIDDLNIEQGGEVNITSYSITQPTS